MKITMITNACCTYEHDGFRLLADPWLVPGAFGTWVHDPPLKTKPEDVAGVDALYISHIHPDHLDEKTLEVFRRDIPIVTLKDQLSLAERKLISLGFTNVIALADGEFLTLGPMCLNMFGPFTKHPFYADACEIGNVVDSALLVHAGGHSVLNANDNTLSVEVAKRLRETYGQIDVAQLNWNSAGPYPACFDNLTHEEKLTEADKCLSRNLAHLAAVAQELRPWVTMPFAGAYKLGYGLEHMNQYLGTCTADEARKYLNEYSVAAVSLVEGESLELG